MFYTALKGSVCVYFGHLSKRKEVASYLNKLKKQNCGEKTAYIYKFKYITSGKFRWLLLGYFTVEGI